MEHRCKLCGNVHKNRLFHAREMLFGWGGDFTYLDCSCCGCLQLLNIPDDLSVYYPKDYYAFRIDAKAWKPPSAFRSFLKRRLARHQLERFDLVGYFTLRRFPHWSVPEWLRNAEFGWDDSLIEIGSGAGGVLLGLREYGFANLVGIDPFIDDDLLYPNGVHIYRRTLDQAEGQYRLVLLHHSFEHMPDPEESLRKAARLCAPQGQIVVSMPMSRCMAWAKYGVDWVGLDAPRHLFLHNEQTVGILASRVGLEVEKVVYDSTAYQFIASEGYRRGIPHCDQRAEDYLTRAEIAEFKREAAELNRFGLGDTASVLLRKAGDVSRGAAPTKGLCAELVNGI